MRGSSWALRRRYGIASRSRRNRRTPASARPAPDPYADPGPYRHPYPAGLPGPASVSVVDGLVERGPEVMDDPRRIRGGHPGLGEQDADELVVRVGVGGGARSAVPAELADGRVVTAVGAHRHPEAPAAVL